MQGIPLTNMIKSRGPNMEPCVYTIDCSPAGLDIIKHNTYTTVFQQENFTTILTDPIDFKLVPKWHNVEGLTKIISVL